MKRMTLIAIFLLLVPVLAAQQAPIRPLPSDAEIRNLLVDRIEKQAQGVGLVVGIVDPSGRRVIAYAKGDAKGIDGTTLFEIGSVTKVFTSLLLADAVARGEVALDDPITKYLPPEMKVPERGGRKITLVDLATHTSGLSRLPSNLLPEDPANPYADYTVEQMYEFISSYELPRDIGTKYEYSNLAVGLLGHLLARRAGVDYETLVGTRITGPLGMKSTAIALTPELQKRLAPGHDLERKRVANWDLATLAGAGALRSSADDMLTFLSAAIGLSETALAKPMESMLKTRRRTDTPSRDIALGWHVTKRDGREIVWHNGATGGYVSSVGFDPKQRLGVVVLGNMQSGAADQLAMHLLDRSVALGDAPKQRKQITLTPDVLERYVGRYELAPGFVLAVTREGDRLFAQATGQPKFEVFAEGPRDFFAKIAEVQLTFVAGEQGPATSLVLHQGGRDMPAKRLAGAEAAPEAVATEIKLPAEALERYVGRYQLAPAFAIAITREGDRLFLQATAQPRVELFASGEKKFFLKVTEAQVTFEQKGEAPASKLILHQNGMNMPGPRID